jgi:anaerobic selenocysteine-containing dehydrogenase
MCPKGQSALQALYHPARIKTPLRRVGERGSGEWESIGWEEAITSVAQKLREIRDRNGPHTVTFIDGEESSGLMKVLAKRFMESFGSPNYVSKSSSVMDERLMKSVALDGQEGFYDISKAKIVLSFGFNFIETFYSPLQGIQAYSELKGGERKIIYVGSRLSVTGIKSSEWIEVNPGTEGLLALGLIKVIVEELIFNRDFVRNRSSKFEGFENAVKRFDLSQISHETGVSEKVIEDLARKFAGQGASAVAIGNFGTIADQTAINSLNILTGSIGRLWWDHDKNSVPYSELPEIVLDSRARSGLEESSVARDFNLRSRAFESLPENIIAGRPYPTQALLIYYSNPLLSVPNTEKMRQALEKVPFIVNFSPFMDETAQLSDIILPDHTPLETWKDVPQMLLDGTPVLGLSQPIVGPLHNTKHSGDVLIELANKIGSPVRSSIPWSSFNEFLKFSLNGVFASGQGELVDGKNYQEYEDWQSALTQSAWWNPKGRKTPKGPVEFRVDLVTRVSHGESPSEEYPFHLNVYKLMTLTKPRNTAQPTLFDIAAPHIFRKWVAWVEINPETAHELHLNDEDWVWVESSQGREKFKVKYYKGTKPNVVNIPLIIGSKGYEPWGKDMEQNVLKVVVDQLDPLDGHYLYDTKVKIYKV